MPCALVALATVAWMAPATASAAASAEANINVAQTEQRIDGFGASSAWTAGMMSPADADLAFDATKGVGLSLLRVRITPQGWTLEAATAALAQARGARVWATPWSPPPEDKSNDNINNGGTLLPERADDWAQLIVGFVQGMKSDAGVSLYGVSAQNEPGYVASYDSCVYDGPSLADFIGNHLGPAFDDAGLLDDRGKPLRIIAPETEGWAQFSAFETAIEGSPAALSHVNTIASHSYNGAPSADTTFDPNTMAYWETEVSDPAKPVDPGMTSGLWVAGQIHQAMTVANMNAWHYWWLYPSYGGATPPDNSALWYFPGDGGPLQPAKRLYVMGNFSKFVRPGYRRVDSTTCPAPGVSTSAYYDSVSQQVVVVAINSNSATVPVSFNFPNATTASWSSWVTSPTKNLEAGDAVNGSGVVQYTLAAQSVTTLVGAVTGTSDAGVNLVNNCAVASTGGIGGSNTLPPSSDPGCGLACSTAGRHTTDDAGGLAGIALAALAVLRRRRGTA